MTHLGWMMADQKDDNSLAEFWEYVIAGIVILFFGALYWMLTRDVPDVAEGVTHQAKTVALSDAEPSRIAQVYAERAETAQVPKTSDDTKRDVSRAIDETADKLVDTSANNTVGAVIAQPAAPKIGDVLPVQADSEVVVESSSETSSNVSSEAKGVAETVVIQATNDLEAAITSNDAQTSFVFDALHFDTGSENIKPASRPQIEYVADVLKRYPDVRILIRGHTDNTGSIQGNAKLALDRSVSVGLALAALGVAKSRVEVESVGSNEPVASNDTAEGRRQNRRIELKIIE